MHLKRKMVRAVLDHAQQHRLGAGALAQLCEKYLASYNNHDYHMERNGELEVLRMLAPHHPRVIFDVGANRGDWTEAALRIVDSCVLHSFEIAPSVASELGRRFQGEPRATINPFGLSDETGAAFIDFELNGGHTGTTMLDKEQSVHEHHATERQEVRVVTGDTYCASHGIAGIDFLKMDVEGAEQRVLSGFSSMLNDGRIGLIQFEYNSINIGSRQLLRDYFRLLERYGFSVGKLWARGASFGAYDFREENFRGPNYLAVHESRPALREQLSYHPRRVR